MIELAVFGFIFTNLLVTLISRAISEELYCAGSEQKWISERCKATQYGSQIHDIWTSLVDQ